MGRFSDPPSDGVFFHGFPSRDALEQALEKGQFGKNPPGMTSCGTTKSHSVPHVNRIWFKLGPGLKLNPLYYADKGEDVATARFFAADKLGIDPSDTAVGQLQNEGEQEWYIRRPIRFDEIQMVRADRYRSAANLIRMIALELWESSI